MANPLFDYALKFVIGIVFIILIDFVWIVKIAGKFYKDNLASIGRIVDGAWQANILASVLVWVCLLIGVMIFVHPLTNGSPLKALIFGAIFGLLVYGVYDLTNFAVLKDWPLKMVFVDMAWGTVLCGLTSWVTLYVPRLF